MPKTFTIGTYDKKHKENLAKRARKVQQLYDAAIKRIAQAAAPSLFDADTKKEFHFEDFPALKKEMEAVKAELRDERSKRKKAEANARKIEQKLKDEMIISNQ